MSGAIGSPNPYPVHWAQFEQETGHHELTVLLDDGLHRHVRMALPGTRIWSWDVVTWPGHMWVGGDIGCGYTWSREHDMFQWANTSGYPDYDDGAPHIQADYWSEKLTSVCRGSAREFSPERLRETIEQMAQDPFKSGWSLSEALEEARWCYDGNEAARLLSDLGEDDLDERSWTDWDHHYILACYAIETTIRAYYRMKETTT